MLTIVGLSGNQKFNKCTDEQTNGRQRHNEIPVFLNGIQNDAFHHIYLAYLANTKIIAERSITQSTIPAPMNPPVTAVRPEVEPSDANEISESVK